jgi:hypothetical protein
MSGRCVFVKRNRGESSVFAVFRNVAATFRQVIASGRLLLRPNGRKTQGLTHDVVRLRHDGKKRPM